MIKKTNLVGLRRANLSYIGMATGLVEIKYMMPNLPLDR